MGNYKDRPLIGYLPEVIKKIREYKALIQAEQPEIFALFEAVQRALDNQFILSSTEYGVKRWEKMLKIMPKATFTLDERKFTILARLAEQLPFTYRRLEQMLTELCGAYGYEVILRHTVYEIEVIVKLEKTSNYDAVREMLKRVIPANLDVFNVLEAPDETAALYTATASALTIMTTTLPELAPGDFKASVTPIYGAATFMSTELPLLPDVPRRAYFKSAETGAVIEIYIRDKTGEITPAYIKLPEIPTERSSP